MCWCRMRHVAPSLNFIGGSWGHARDIGGCPAERPELRGGTRKAPILPQWGSSNFEWGGLVSSGPLTNWTGRPPIAAHKEVSSSSNINGSSGSSINGDSYFGAFCDHLHESVEFSKGGGQM